MNTHENRLATRFRRLAIVALAACAAALTALGSAPQKADAYWVCPTNAGQWRPAYFVCAHTTYRPTIAYVEKNSDPRGYAVYRSSVPRGGSVSGTEFYSPTSNYYLQAFHCAAGYPNARNRHTVEAYVLFTLAGSC